MTTLLSLSTSLPPNAQTTHWHHVLPSPVALPSAIPAGVRGDSRLRPHVLPALAVDTHLDSILVLERLDVDHVAVDIALDETAPAQHAQLRALLWRVAPLRVGIFDPDERADRGSGGDRCRRLQEFAPLEFTHCFLLRLWATFDIALTFTRQAACCSPRRKRAPARDRARGESDPPDGSRSGP